jgi:hypothetical protein
MISLASTFSAPLQHCFQCRAHYLEHVSCFGELCTAPVTYEPFSSTCWLIRNQHIGTYHRRGRISKIGAIAASSLSLSLPAYRLTSDVREP